MDLKSIKELIIYLLALLLETFIVMMIWNHLPSHISNGLIIPFVTLLNLRIISGLIDIGFAWWLKVLKEE